VRVKHACLVDELRDFSKVAAKSDGLALNNDFNALYAEYLFRAKGGSNEWLAYQVPGAMESVKVVAFIANAQDPDLTLQSSADGAGYSDLTVQRQSRALPSPPGGAAHGQRRTMIEYSATPPAGQRFLKIRWNGAAELDRVEILHPGAAGP